MPERQAVIFDFDGTLTKSYLDFDEIRAEIGIDGGPILEAIGEMNAEARAHAETILQRHEWEAARNAQLQPGAREVVAACRAHNVPVAILTRNARPTLDFVLDRYDLTVDAIRTRDDGAIKPSPEPVHSICKQLGVTAASSWMVGDHLFDVRTGKAAGTRTVLFVDDGGLPQDTGGADHIVHRLEELLPLVLG
ncbi:MAG: HAD family hydrolase [Planctomycetes bacterium]|nr:HAD family hydrolase [Planctomycetota bacterium]